MTTLPKAYEPQKIQDKIYEKWEKSGLWHADATSERPPFSIVMPPPNITGVLTLGHVLNNTIQDILCRKARMEGKEVLWIPGTDHAGLATQSVVEKHLRKTEKKTRHDFTREEFLKKTWQWREKHGDIIIRQLRKLGASCDWERLRFTMDNDYAEAVQKVFMTLYEKGLIYRGKRMVNWCPASLTAISDEEVITKPQSSKMYYVKYQLVDSEGEFLTIATTRPETIMADAALAVHPEDPRYAKWIGKSVWRSLARKKIPIIADDYIDPEFGTGVLKVTPAHDKADFEIGKRHNLPIDDVLHPNGKINSPEEAELDGLDRFEARTKSCEILAERGLFEKEETYENSLGFSERGDVPIEPRLSDQWFLRYPKIKEAQEALRKGNIKFVPSHWEKVYHHWLDNIQDWCISRQVWWGHRIPVWYRGEEVKCCLEKPEGEGWKQDEDTLDTWFSSWLWAYETMDEAARKKFYPTSILVTGPDIIFLWVARMIIAGLEFKPSEKEAVEENIAFKDVYFTGLIRDGKGRKMSKSLGNSPDPLVLIEKYGADGVRFGMMHIAPQGQDIRFDEKQIEEGRNFCNKLWNACRFRSLQGEMDGEADPSLHNLSVFSLHTLTLLKDVVKETNRYLDAYEFSQAADVLHRFIWKRFCSEFIEAAKVDFYDENSETRQGTLATCDYVISVILRLLHPFAPFVTEELWKQLGFSAGKSIQTCQWVKQLEILEKLGLDKQEADFVCAENIYQAAGEGRRLRSEYGVASNKKVSFSLLQSDEKLSANEEKVFASLLGAENILSVTDPLTKTPMLSTSLGQLYMPLGDLIDVDKECQRLEKEIAKTQKDIDLTHQKLKNPKIMEKAPPQKIEGWKAHSQGLEEKIEKLKAQVTTLA